MRQRASWPHMHADVTMSAINAWRHHYKDGSSMLDCHGKHLTSVGLPHHQFIAWKTVRPIKLAVSSGKTWLKYVLPLWWHKVGFDHLQ